MTTAFADTYQAARDIGGGTVYAKGSTYIVDHIEHRHRVTLRGDGARLTIIRAKAGSTSPGLITLRSGYVQRAHIQGVGLVGNGNTGQAGIYFESVGVLPDNNAHGGTAPSTTSR